MTEETTTKGTTYGAMLEKFIDDNGQFGVALEDINREDGIATIRKSGLGSVDVNLNTGEIDYKQVKPDAPFCGKLRDALGGNVPAIPGRGGQVSPISPAVQSLRDIQDEEARPFVVDYKTGKKAAPAAQIIRAANAEGLSYEILDYVHEKDFVKVSVRVKTPKGRFNDAVVSVYKDEYLAPYAWELVQNNCQSAVTGVDLATGMPIFKEGATVRVRKSRDGSSTFEEIPALLWLAQKLSARWLFAPRSCETKAKARAAKQLLNTDAAPVTFQEAEEIADEEMESKLVEES